MLSFCRESFLCGGEEVLHRSVTFAGKAKSLYARSLSGAERLFRRLKQSLQSLTEFRFGYQLPKMRIGRLELFQTYSPGFHYS